MSFEEQIRQVCQSYHCPQCGKIAEEALAGGQFQFLTDLAMHSTSPRLPLDGEQTITRRCPEGHTFQNPRVHA